MKKHKLSWVDDFLYSIKPYVYMRLRDNVLIRMPNEAYKLNSSGARVIAHILNGGSVQDFINARADSPETESQLERFFIDFSRLWNKEVCENYKTAAVYTTEFSIGYIQLPVLSEVALTYACNIKCRFCYGDCTQNKDEGHLNTKGFKKILDIIRYEAEVPSVSFTGGEPTLYKDLPELIKYASGHNKMRVNLITNATVITPSKAGELARAGLSSAQVSIESAYAHEHDAITGVPGSHAASVAGLKALKEAGVHVYCVITAKPSFGLVQYLKKVIVPENIVVEYEQDYQAEVLVIRQRTTDASGYHTNINICIIILAVSLINARMILNLSSKLRQEDVKSVLN